MGKQKTFKIILSLCLVLIMLLSSTQITYAWGGSNQTGIRLAKYIDARILGEKFDGLFLEYENVHYEKTLAWTLDEGFSKKESKLIAESCKDVDNIWGNTFKDKTWHLGDGWEASINSWEDVKENYRSRNDTRIKHSLECMNNAKNAIDQMSGKDETTRQSLMDYALTSIGNGLHPLQDFFGHMNAGKDKLNNSDFIPDFYEDMHHGEEGKQAEVYFFGTNVHASIDLELLYDATNIDFRDGKWHFLLEWDSEDNTRLQKTDRATREYLREFKEYLEYSMRSTLHGRVVNKYTNNGIPDAAVCLFDSRGALVSIGDTDEYGYYRLEHIKEGDYKIEVKKLLPNSSNFVAYNTGNINKVHIAPDSEQELNIGIYRVLKSIETNINSVTIGVGDRKLFINDLNIAITGHYKDGGTEDLSYLVGVTSSNTGVVTVVGGYVTGVSKGSATMTCGYLGNPNDPETYREVKIGVNVIQKELARLVANISELEMEEGQEIRFVPRITVTGIYKDGTSVDFTHKVGTSTDNENIATIRDGVIKGISPGETYLRCGITDEAAVGSPYFETQILIKVKARNIGTISGNVKDAITNSPISGANISVLNNLGSIVANTTTDTTGKYTVLYQPGTNYRVHVSKVGYLPIDYNGVIITQNQTTYLETILQIDEQYSGIGIIQGKISDAFNGSGLSGVQISLRKGINALIGDIVATTTTDYSGNYTLPNLEAGNYTAELTKAGYTTAYITVVCIGNRTNYNQNGTLTPVISDGQIRIILTWGSSPSDLDSHLTGPASNESRFHIYYSNRSYINNGDVYADLDVDDTSSYGPETITIYNQQPGVYRYYIHDYSNSYSSSSYALANSAAKVKVFKGSNKIGEYNVPIDKEGTLWKVFEINGDTITVINELTYEASPGNVGYQSSIRMMTVNPTQNYDDSNIFINLPSKTDK